MQGNNAANSIVTALDSIYENEEHFDVVVIIRGGGSQLDLACFDDYNLALHISQFPLPILTGIGHEKDETIADLVANTRLKTPTAVAEFLIGKFDGAASEITGLQSAFFEMITDRIDAENQRVEGAARVLKPLVNSKIERAKRLLGQSSVELKSMVREAINQQQFHLLHLSNELKSETHSFVRIRNKELISLATNTTLKAKFEINSEKQQLISNERRLFVGTKQLLDKFENQLHVLEKNKQLVDPITIFNRGFSITLHNGKAVKSSDGLNVGDELETLLSYGKVKSVVQNLDNQEFNHIQ